MSNHLGGHMLNELLIAMAKDEVFEKLDKKDTRRILKNVFDIGYNYDCNPGEILEGLSAYFEVCYCCLEFDRELEGGLCKECKH